jgi:hypothetical protein
VAGPPVADKHSAVDKNGNITRPATHWLYIPFIRANTALNGGGPWELWIARSKDGGVTWDRFKVADRGVHDPGNIFPELTIDTSGNLYYTWAETQGPSSTVDQTTTLTTPTANRGGETDVYYAFSPPGGEAWSPPIPLTQEANDSAVFPWMVAGDAGQVDLVYYKANNGLNPNIDFADTNGNACTEGDTGCTANPAAWNVYFAQSQNALNTGSNFKSVQISDHPNHIGQICTQGLSCSGDRDLLDFFTVDVDHLGAANVMWADDNTSRTTDTRNKFSRQLSGNSVFKNQTINLLGSWPIQDHAVSDRGGDVFDPAGFPKASCPGMDILGAGASRSDDLITISLTLNGAPTAAKAIACGATGIVDDGGVWGAEFWAAREPGTDGTPRAESFYIAYSDPPGGQAGVEGGRVDNVNATITSLEFHRTTGGTLGGTCTFPSPPETMPPFSATPCTITMTVSASLLGIKSGAGLYSITGLSTYFFGTGHTLVVPGTRLEPGNSEQADAATAFDINGTGTTK